jgi:hypothetical protein
MRLQTSTAKSSGKIESTLAVWSGRSRERMTATVCGYGGLRHPHDDEAEKAHQRERDHAHGGDPPRAKPGQEVQRPVHVEGIRPEARGDANAPRRSARISRFRVSVWLRRAGAARLGLTQAPGRGVLAP